MPEENTTCELTILDEYAQITEEQNKVIGEIVKEIPSECYVMEDTS